MADERWPTTLAPWAERAEQAYIAHALGRPLPAPLPLPATWPEAARAAAPAAAACAVGARYLAVGKPRSLGIVADDPARAHVLALAHKVWHQPRDLRWAISGPADELAALVREHGGRVVSQAEALTADVACVDLPIEVSASSVRRGSHVALVRATVSAELLALATCTAESAGEGIATTLGELAAGLRDGRQLDELTVLLLGGHGGTAQARAALADR